MKNRIITLILAITLIAIVVMTAVGCARHTPDKLLKALGDGSNYSIKMTSDNGEYEFVSNGGNYYSKSDDVVRYYIIKDGALQLYTMIDGKWSVLQGADGEAEAKAVLKEHTDFIQPFVAKLKSYSTSIDDYKIKKNVWQSKDDGSYLEVVDKDRLQVILPGDGINDKTTFSYGMPKSITLPAAASKVNS